MVSFETVQKSNSLISTVPKGLVALFIGATSGIGQSALQQFAQHASSPRIYTVARPQSVASHQKLLDSLRQSNPSSTYNLITADVALISEVSKIVDAVKKAETKLDILVVSPGFMPFEGRIDTSEGLDPSMTTRYYSRLRAVEQLLPLLNNAPSPRIVSVLAGGVEAPLNEDDLGLKDPKNWTTWNSSLHSATMGTLALERFARQNPKLSIVHWYPGPVDTPGLARAAAFGASHPDKMSQDEGGARALFFATSDRYSVHGGLVLAPEGLGEVKKTGGGIYILNPEGESTDNEKVLAKMRNRGVDEAVWTFTEQIFAATSK
ncbi:short-chain dehydrogenase reductase [Fusarium albosuccineum]|uniref:Short-chain dehydrogenase reductase n=1 Tax=Fusarium albosuccineum TaxID=1237068 RepID=A0A8H4LR98_9HYPO|nr:short-chain dehydrogenase reductase [Fusarium albosuccineum]